MPTFLEDLSGRTPPSSPAIEAAGGRARVLGGELCDGRDVSGRRRADCSLTAGLLQGAWPKLRVMHCYALIVNPHTIDALAGRETTSLGRRRRRYAFGRPSRRVQPELNRVFTS